MALVHATRGSEVGRRLHRHATTKTHAKYAWIGCIFEYPLPGLPFCSRLCQQFNATAFKLRYGWEMKSEFNGCVCAVWHVCSHARDRIVCSIVYNHTMWWQERSIGPTSRHHHNPPVSIRLPSTPFTTATTHKNTHSNG